MSSAVGAVARWIAPSLTVAAVAGMGLVSDPVQVGPAPAVRLADEVNPLVGAPFYVNPAPGAMRAAQKADPSSPELTAIANTPQAYWIVPGSSASTVAKYVGDAQAAGAIPILALYGIPTATAAASLRAVSDRPRILPHMDRRHRSRHRRCAGGGHRRTRCARHGRLPVGRPASGTLRPDPLCRRYADPQSGRGRVRRRRSLALAQSRGHGRQAQPGRCGQRAGFQPQHRELLDHR